MTDFKDLWAEATPIDNRPGWWVSKDGKEFMVTTSTIWPHQPWPDFIKNGPIIFETYTPSHANADVQDD